MGRSDLAEMLLDAGAEHVADDDVNSWTRAVAVDGAQIGCSSKLVWKISRVPMARRSNGGN